MLDDMSNTFLHYLIFGNFFLDMIFKFDILKLVTVFFKFSVIFISRILAIFYIYFLKLPVFTR